MSTNENPKSEEKLSVWKVIGSILSAVLGVQSGDKASRDFKEGKASTFIIVASVFVVVIVVFFASLASFIGNATH